MSPSELPLQQHRQRLMVSLTENIQAPTPQSSTQPENESGTVPTHNLPPLNLEQPPKFEDELATTDTESIFELLHEEDNSRNPQNPSTTEGAAASQGDQHEHTQVYPVTGEASSEQGSQDHSDVPNPDESHAGAAGIKPLTDRAEVRTSNERTPGPTSDNHQGATERTEDGVMEEAAVRFIKQEDQLVEVGIVEEPAPMVLNQEEELVEDGIMEEAAPTVIKQEEEHIEDGNMAEATPAVIKQEEQLIEDGIMEAAMPRVIKEEAQVVQINSEPADESEEEAEEDNEEAGQVQGSSSDQRPQRTRTRGVKRGRSEVWTGHWLRSRKPPSTSKRSKRTRYWLRP